MYSLALWRHASYENKRDEITQVTLKQVTKSFISLTGPGVGCQYAKAAILKNEIYQQLLITTKELGERETADKKASEDMVDQKKVKNEYGQLPFEGEVLHKQIVSEDRAEQEKAEEAAAAETAAAQKLTEEHRVLAQQKAEEKAIAEKRAAEKQKAEEADATIIRLLQLLKVAAVKKVAEEKSALAAYEVARKKKAN